MLDKITPMIITYNEAENVRRTLDKLTWAQRILIVDSGSTDGTIKMVQAYSQVEVIHHAFTDFADQCNFSMTHIATPWVLSLDADYELSDNLIVDCAHSCRPREFLAIGHNSSIGSMDDRFAVRFIRHALCFIERTGHLSE